MKNMKFVFAVSFCAMFAASAALATAPNLDNSDMGTPHGVFTDLAPTDENGAGAGIAGVTYVNRAVNSAGAAAIAAEAHAAAAGAYAVSAKTSADNAAAAADSAATAAGNAQTAAASALQKDDIKTGTSNGAISVDGTDVAVQGLGSAAYTAADAYATAAQGALADTAVQPTDLAAVATTGSYNDLSDTPTIPSGALASKNTITNDDVAEDAAIAQSKIGGLTAALDGKQAILTTTNVVTGGTGNVVTAVTAADGTVTVTKGTTLGGLATKSEVASADITDETITTADIKNGAVTAIKTTGIIGKVPSGSEDSTTLASIWLQ